ncbi:hypothetical protein Ppb6_00057 [Photorhabdus australis subsp. thailandensis]|uniref:Uncharacterized protein n=1 Tax=Photorhabdus australis subsp. thailandensis TaxID=2805096 RepID=A0A1C0U9Y1_9GAMM|nr:hypothetical protein Ppb6_00057 [Photorhabdus australis subsp. thailandensis]
MKSPYYTVDKLGSSGSDVTYPILHKWLPNNPFTVPDQSDLRIYLLSFKLPLCWLHSLTPVT